MRFVRTSTSVLFVLLLAVTLAALAAGIALSSTLLNARFLVTEVGRVDVEGLVSEEVKQQVPAGAEFLYPVIDQASIDLEPWLREQIAIVAQAAVTYFKEQQPVFHVSISLVEPKQYLVTQIEEMLSTSPPEGFPAISPQQLDAFATMIEQQVDLRVPDTFDVNEAFLGEETVAQLREVQRYTGYLSTGLHILPVVAVLLILGIALVQWRRWRAATRYTGLGFLLGGALGFAAGLALLSELPPRLVSSLPQEIAVALPGFVSDIVHPFFIYCGVALAVGLALVLLSFWLRAADV